MTAPKPLEFCTQHFGVTQQRIRARRGKCLLPRCWLNLTDITRKRTLFDVIANGAAIIDEILAAACARHHDRMTMRQKCDGNTLGTARGGVS